MLTNFSGIITDISGVSRLDTPLTIVMGRDDFIMGLIKPFGEENFPPRFR